MGKNCTESYVPNDPNWVAQLSGMGVVRGVVRVLKICASYFPWPLLRILLCEFSSSLIIPLHLGISPVMCLPKLEFRC